MKIAEEPPVATFRIFRKFCRKFVWFPSISRKVDLRQNNKIRRNFGVRTQSYNGQQTVVIFVMIR